MLEWNKYNREINNLKVTATKRREREKNVPIKMYLLNAQREKERINSENRERDRDEHKSKTLAISSVIRQIADWNHCAHDMNVKTYFFSLCTVITDCNSYWTCVCVCICIRYCVYRWVWLKLSVYRCTTMWKLSLDSINKNTKQLS